MHSKITNKEIRIEEEWNKKTGICVIAAFVHATCVSTNGIYVYVYKNLLQQSKYILDFIPTYVRVCVNMWHFYVGMCGDNMCKYK